MLGRSVFLAGLVALFGCSIADGNDAPAPSNDGGSTSDAQAGDASATTDGASHVDATTDGPKTCGPLATPPASVLYYDLRSAPFPDASTPSVAVHVPPGFDPSNQPGLIVFFHGFENCVSNVVGSVDSPCVDGGAARDALHLIDQVDQSRVNAILVAVELEVDQSTGNPGQLTTPGDFNDLVHELFAEHLNAVIGCALDVDAFDRIVVSTHSGGYEAAASVLAYGMVPNVREVDLLDSLYGEISIFDDWVTDAAARFAPGRPDGLRLMNVYTSSGGTEVNSRDMAVQAEGWLAEAGVEGGVLFDDTTDDLDAAAYAHPMIFKLTALAHGDVPKFYFQEFAQASGFATIP